MTNWCRTDVVFEGSKENIKKLNEDISRVLQTKREETEENKLTFEPNSFWLGHIVQDILNLSWKDVPCRGVMIDYPRFNRRGKKAIVTLLTATAWEPCLKLLKLLEKKYDVTMYYSAEEPGNALYWTNDFKEKYFGLYKVAAQDEEGYEDDYTYATSKELDSVNEAMQDDNKKIVTYKYELVM